MEKRLNTRKKKIVEHQKSLEKKLAVEHQKPQVKRPSGMTITAEK